MKARIKCAIAIGAAMWLVPLTQAVAGIDVEAGDWKMDFSGNVNAFYVNADCDHDANTAVTGGLACTGDNATSVRNGLLPAALRIQREHAAGQHRHQRDHRFLSRHQQLGRSRRQWRRSTGSPADARHRCASGIPDVRRCQLGHGENGPRHRPVRQGRDPRRHDPARRGHRRGQRSAQATPASAASAWATSTPTGSRRSPTRHPSSWDSPHRPASFQPLDDGNYTTHNSPEWQANVSYVFGDPKNGPFSGKVWVDGVTQYANAPTTCPPSLIPFSTFCVANNNINGIRNNVHGNGIDAGVKFDMAGFEAVLYGYYGNGLGTTGLYILATSSTGQLRESNGGYAQLTYKIDRLKIGASYGISELKLASDERAYGIDPTTGMSTGAPASDLVHKNESGVFGLVLQPHEEPHPGGRVCRHGGTSLEQQRSEREGHHCRRDHLLLTEGPQNAGAAAQATCAAAV